MKLSEYFHAEAGQSPTGQAAEGIQTHLDSIIASAMDAIISLSTNQRIILFNPAAEKMFGVNAQEAIGKHINRFIPERFRAAHIRDVENFGRTGASHRHMGALGMVWGLRANGEEFPIEASISQVTVRGTAGEEKLYTVILRDITERVRAEEALKKAEAQLQAHAEDLKKKVAESTTRLRETVADLEAFSYSLSHDIRTPLRAILSFTQLALEESRQKISPASIEYLEKAIRAADRLNTLVKDLLAFTRVYRHQVELKPLDVEEIVRQIIHERPGLQPPKTELAINGPLLPMVGHEVFLTQCLANLLENAAKHVAPLVTPRIRIYSEDLGGQARLWVADNGIGINFSKQQQIAKMLQHSLKDAEYEETGIGLIIVRNAVERMGGQAGLESELGKGSRFWIQLRKAI